MIAPEVSAELICRELRRLNALRKAKSDGATVVSVLED